jgi:hypothetical protein
MGANYLSKLLNNNEVVKALKSEDPKIGSYFLQEIAPYFWI